MNGRGTKNTSNQSIDVEDRDEASFNEKDLNRKFLSRQAVSATTNIIQTMQSMKDLKSKMMSDKNPLTTRSSIEESKSRHENMIPGNL